MEIMKKIWQNKQSRSSLITAALSLILMISLLIATFQMTAWFNNRHTVTTPATITNFQTIVEYSLDNAATWTTLNSGESIPIEINVTYNENNKMIVSSSLETLQVQITYKGKSNAYLRTSVFGGFKNADTGTALPQTEGLWSLKGVADQSQTKWIQNGTYLRYKEKLGDTQNSTNLISNYQDTYVLECFTVELDPSCLSSEISPHQDYTGELFVIVDAVQPDRIDALWE